MARQQEKRRRKRYQPGSAYAGHVRPTGILGLLGSARTIRLVFILMALALVAGGAVGIFGTGVLGGGSQSNPAGFVLPEDEDGGTPGPETTPSVRQYAAPPEMTIDPDKRYLATIKTALGDIEVELLAAQAPDTVNNFVFLARDGFYDGLIFHRAEPGFTVQAGDPSCAAGTERCRGSGGPGYDLAQEDPGDFQAGTLGMANASQFFIALTESEQFSDFTPFARILSGLDVAEQLTVGTQIQTIEIREQ